MITAMMNPFPRSRGTRSTHIPRHRRPSLDRQRQHDRMQRNRLRRAQTHGVPVLGGPWALGGPPVSTGRWVSTGRRVSESRRVSTGNSIPDLLQLRMLERHAQLRPESRRFVVRSSSRQGWFTSTRTRRSARRPLLRVGTTDRPRHRTPRRVLVAASKRTVWAGHTLARRDTPASSVSTIRPRWDPALRWPVTPSARSLRQPPARAGPRMKSSWTRGPNRLCRWAYRPDRLLRIASGVGRATRMPMPTSFPSRTQVGRASLREAGRSRVAPESRRPRGQ